MSYRSRSLPLPGLVVIPLPAIDLTFDEGRLDDHPAIADGYTVLAVLN